MGKRIQIDFLNHPKADWFLGTKSFVEPEQLRSLQLIQMTVPIAVQNFTGARNNRS